MCIWRNWSALYQNNACNLWVLHQVLVTCHFSEIISCGTIRQYLDTTDTWKIKCLIVYNFPICHYRWCFAVVPIPTPPPASTAYMPKMSSSASFNCKFYPNCKNMSCPFTHPTVSRTPLLRNIETKHKTSIFTVNIHILVVILF